MLGVFFDSIISFVINFANIVLSLIFNPSSDRDWLFRFREEFFIF
ncbi:hypothetical protein X925_04035 [Petrotoga sp. 9T1HF07.CasAA.8.2]|nr:hypothetical protein X925_04035 [Petrotoga sp. 9T1HF07.CasAA.8.2]